MTRAQADSGVQFCRTANRLAVLVVPDPIIPFPGDELRSHFTLGLKCPPVRSPTQLIGMCALRLGRGGRVSSTLRSKSIDGRRNAATGTLEYWRSEDT